MKVLTITAHRGGVGKTFLAVHLFIRFKQLGKSVLGIDTDTQAHLMRWGSQGNWDASHPIWKSEDNLGELFWLPFNPPETTGFQKEFSKYLEQSKDLVIVDGRPILDLSRDILKRAEVILVPVVGRLSFESAQDIQKVASEISEELAHKIVVIVNMAKERWRIGRRELELLQSMKFNLFPMAIPDSHYVRTAELELRPVWEVKYSGRSIVPACIEHLVTYLWRMQFGWEK